MLETKGMSPKWRQRKVKSYNGIERVNGRMKEMCKTRDRFQKRLKLSERGEERGRRDGWRDKTNMIETLVLENKVRKREWTDRREKGNRNDKTRRLNPV